MRKYLRLIFENKLVYFLVRLVLKFNEWFSSFISHLKMKALMQQVGRKSSCHWTVEIKYGENITMGYHSCIGPYSCIGAMSPIKIGSYVRISRGVVIETAGLDLTKPTPYPHTSKSITIEDGVWIASNAIILGGLTIGANSIIGAGVVVSKNVAPNSIMVGQPLRNLNQN
jgi:acetyltransferase-like isoleucine patch superfamily enzyme